MLIVIGTFLPIIGVILTVVLALKLPPGRKRWMVLFGVPLITLLLCCVFGRQIAYDGNLLFAVIFGGFALMLFFYYPVLIVAAIVGAMKRAAVTKTADKDNKLAHRNFREQY